VKPGASRVKQATSADGQGRSVTIDGESDWLEGAMLIAVYVMLGVGFFYAT
jgi:hypothetical protein